MSVFLVERTRNKYIAGRSFKKKRERGRTVVFLLAGHKAQDAGRRAQGAGRKTDAVF